MSLKSKIEAVIYASEEPVTLQQLVGLLAEEAQAEIDDIAASQALLPLGITASAQDDASAERTLLEAGTHEAPESAQPDAAVERAVSQGEVVPAQPDALDLGTYVVDESTSERTGEEPVVNEVPTPEEGDLPVEAASSGQAPLPEPAADYEKRRTRDRERAVREHVRRAVDELIREYAQGDRGIEIREVASGFRMGTKPEYHDAVRGFVKSLKPALKLTLPALETLAVVAYKQPVTAAEISEIRGVDSAGVLGGLMARKLIATAGRKQVIGRPMLYKTTRDFLLRFGLKDVGELPSMEEFERMAGELAEQEDLPMESPDTIIEEANVRGDAEMIRGANSHNEADEAQTSFETENQQNATAESAAGGNDEEADQRNDGELVAKAEPQTEEEPQPEEEHAR